MVKQPSTRQSRSRAAAGESVPVVREPTFSRFTLDESIVVPIGSELEIICLIAGPAIDGIDVVGDMQQIRANAVWAEAARIRLGAAEAVNLAMRILQTGIATGQLNKEGAISTISNMSSPLPAAE